MTNPELIERVADAIRTSKDAGAFFNDWRDWEYEAIAAIATVRSYDCEVGPSEAEIDAAGPEVLQSNWDIVQLRPWHYDLVKLGLDAAAVERQRRDGEEATNDR
jgi:hypothetical protein